METFRNSTGFSGTVMSRCLSLLGLAAAMFGTMAAHGVEAIDLTAAARAAGSSAYEVSATSQQALSGGNGPAYTTFDGIATTRWQSGNGLDQCLNFRFTDTFEPGKYLQVTSYRLQSHSGWYGDYAANSAWARMPAAWTFEGSDDGENWTVLDTRNVSTNDWTKDSGNYIYQTFTVASPTCFRQYRLHFTARNYGGNKTWGIAYQIGEVDLNGKVLIVPDEEARSLSWIGGASGDWNVAGNWTNKTTGVSRVPQDGDIADISPNAAATVRVPEPTADLAFLRLGGGSGVATLETTNWTTCVSASNLVVLSKGVITCGGGGTNEATVSRVWLKGHDITIATGGKIDVDYKGYGEVPKTSTGSYRTGYGPAGGKSDRGAAHGGYGGRTSYCTMPAYQFNVMPCDDPVFPSQPGSSGSASGYATGKQGGGAVRIEATGRVTVNGTITANGKTVSAYTTVAGYSSFSSNHESAGAGGAVWISCETFAGVNGIVRANGGWGDMAVENRSTPGAAAGGGMIAIHYDASAQSAGLVSGMTFSVAPGFHGWSENYKTNRQLSAWNREHAIRASADLGTLWFTDAKLLESLGRGITGQIMNAPESMTLDSLAISNGWFRFAREGFTLNVTGDMTVSGKDSCYEVGGVTPTNRTAFIELYSSAAAHLNVGGKLTVVDKGRLDVHAADTNRSGTAFGAYVSVGGDFEVGTNGVVYSWSDPVGGGSPHFDVAGDFTVLASGLVSAEWRGYAAGHQSSGFPIRRAFGYGPGHGRHFTHTYLAGHLDELFSYVTVGGGHGGQGGWKDGAANTSNSDYHTSGLPYDDALRPSQPGSGGAGNDWTLCGGAGGGVVYVEAKGVVRVDGEINANGWHGSGYRTSGGAGGAVFLRGSSFAGGETGVISAKGSRGGPGSDTSDGTAWSNAHPDRIHYYWMLEGAGAGGRIAIWTGLNPDVQSHVSLRKATTCEGFLGTITAAGGVNPGGNMIDTYGENINGEDGTVWFVNGVPSPGAMLMLR